MPLPPLRGCRSMALPQIHIVGSGWRARGRLLPPVPALADSVGTIGCGPSVPAVNAVALKNQGLMSLFLRPHEPHWGTKHIWGTVHRAAALVIEAEDGGNHIAAAFRSFQCWGALRLITDPSGLRSPVPPRNQRQKEAQLDCAHRRRPPRQPLGRRCLE